MAYFISVPGKVEPGRHDVLRFGHRSHTRCYRPRVSSASVSTKRADPRSCKIADALEAIGDRWSLLIVRELTLGVHRFTDIRANTGAPREMLTARLRKLEKVGVLCRHRYHEHPPRDEYLLTEAGEDLQPVLRALRRWGERHT